MADLFKTRALVIHTIRWSESSKIVHLFTESKGYMKVVAKGALRPRSPFRGTLESLNEVEAIISVKESRELQVLTSVALLHAFMNIRADLPKTATALAIFELVEKLFRTHEPVKPFYRYLVALLLKLDAAQIREPWGILWHFLFHFSQILGFGWQLTTCRICGGSPQAFPVFLDHISGSLCCARCALHKPPKGPGLNREQWHMVQQLQTPAIDKLDQFPGAPLQGQEEAFTEILLKHLAYHTDISLELKSLKWFH